VEKFTGDIFSPDAVFNISEVLEPTEKNSAILCTLKGEFFFPDGYSRNKRFYPKELWEKSLNQPNIIKKLAERRFYGTISHEQEINDKAFLEGKISHIVTEMKITNEGQGYGELVVLNTPAGKIVDVFARAQSKLFLSTRGSGTFKGEKDGMPIVNPENFILESVDFVLEPGFEEASPEMLEALNKLNQSEEPKGDEQMDKIIETLQASVNKKEEEIKELREKLDATETQLDQVNKENDVLVKSNESLTEAKTILEGYQALGTVEELTEMLEKSPKIIKEWSDFSKIGDTASEIKEALELSEKVITAYEEIGKPHEIVEALELLEGFKNQVDAIGTVEEINQAVDLLEEYSSKQKEAKTQAEITELAKELNVSEEKISKVYGKISNEEIREMFEGLQDDLSEFRKPKKKVNEDKDEEEEDATSGGAFSKPLAERLIERYSK
jgi:hypothetical protein